jgi:predicted butyrate kinase (DUF1464 family)
VSDRLYDYSPLDDPPDDELSDVRQRLRERIANCSSGEIVAAANRYRAARGVSQEQVARDILIAALFIDGWLEEIVDMMRTERKGGGA